MLSIHALCCGRLRFDRQLFFPDAAPGTPHNVQVPSFLIRHPRGNVLFDTGVDCLAQQDPLGRLGARIAGAFQLCAGPGENMPDQLALLGLRPDDISHVINSHFHFDHCGCNSLFARARFVVQRAEMDAAQAPKNPYNPLNWDHPVDFQLVDGDHDLFGDGSLLLLATPGHTAGHQSLRVKAAPGLDLVLTADACYSRQHLEQSILPGGNAAWQPATMLQTLARLRALQDREGCQLIFGHDPEQWAALRHAPLAMV